MSNVEMFYKKTDPSKVVTINSGANDDTAFYQLSDGNMIKKTDFLKYYAVIENRPPANNPVNESKNTNTSSDYLDPESFFNSSTIVKPNDIDLIKNADPNKGILEGTQRTEVVHRNSDIDRTEPPSMNESLVKQVDPSSVQIPNNTNTNTSNYKVYDDDDEAYNDFLKNKGIQQTQEPVPPPKQTSSNPLDEINQLYDDERMVYGEEEATKRKNARLKKINKYSENQQSKLDQSVVQEQQNQSFLDPSEIMFKSFKRNHDIKISLNFSNKIANPDFIKMMMENIDGDIISFYKKLIVKDIMDNFIDIEKEVEKQLKETIFGEPKKTRKRTVKKKETNIEIEKDEELIPGRVTKSGSQTYKYVDEKGNIKELLPDSAEKRGLKPLKKE